MGPQWCQGLACRDSQAARRCRRSRWHPGAATTKRSKVSASAAKAGGKGGTAAESWGHNGARDSPVATPKPPVGAAAASGWRPTSIGRRLDYTSRFRHSGAASTYGRRSPSGSRGQGDNSRYRHPGGDRSTNHSRVGVMLRCRKCRVACRQTRPSGVHHSHATSP
jgi:hypothetical protein